MPRIETTLICDDPAATFEALSRDARSFANCMRAVLTQAYQSPDKSERDTLKEQYDVTTIKTSIHHERIMSAAPDMLEALAAFVDMSSTDDVNAIIDQAKAALAKARGEDVK